MITLLVSVKNQHFHCLSLAVLDKSKNETFTWTRSVKYIYSILRHNCMKHKSIYVVKKNAKVIDEMYQ